MVSYDFIFVVLHFWFYFSPAILVVDLTYFDLHIINGIVIVIYYIDTNEIPGLFLLLKNHIFIARSEDTIFICQCEDICVAMVTNMISQLQESFPLRRPVLFKCHSQHDSFKICFGCYRIFPLLHQTFEYFGTENIGIVVFISPF